MNRISFLLFFLLLKGIVSGQQKPFILEGTLSNYPFKQIFMAFRQDGGYVIDTAAVNEHGYFYLKSSRIRKPENAYLFDAQKNLLPNLYVAPGYHLSISGDANNLPFTRTMTGVGTESNRYLFLKDSLLAAQTVGASWYEMNDNEFLSFVKSNQLLRHTAYDKVFGRKTVTEPWFRYFAQLTLLDNQFSKFYFLINHIIYQQKFSYKESVAFLAANFDSQTLADLYNEKYLASNEYKVAMSDYAIYLSTINCRKDSLQCSTIKNEYVHLTGIIANTYKGKIRQIKLFEKMQSALRYCRSFEELNMYKTHFPKYIATLGNSPVRENLDSLLLKTERVLFTTQIGKPAPIFTATDSAGAVFSIDSFKGRVVYLDLWASWCLPCRQETPYLKMITEKYKNNNKVIFLSVAVSDKPANWKAALIKDKPEWLQLFDNTGKVQSAYVANSIPKFILIDKNGNIVNFDSPPPSSGPELEKLLDQEIAR